MTWPIFCAIFFMSFFFSSQIFLSSLIISTRPPLRTRLVLDLLTQFSTFYTEVVVWKWYFGIVTWFFYYSFSLASRARRSFSSSSFSFLPLSAGFIPWTRSKSAFFTSRFYQKILAPIVSSYLPKIPETSISFALRFSPKFIACVGRKKYSSGRKGCCFGCLVWPTGIDLGC